MLYTDTAEKCFLQEKALGPVLFTLSINICITLMKVTNYTEPGRTAHKRGTNKNNLVPSEVRSSKIVRSKIIMK